MSMTFSIQGLGEEHGYELPCTACGVSLLGALEPGERRHLDCRVCLGYGGPEELPKVRHELNVHNGNGVALLAALGLPTEAAGEVGARDLLVSLELRGDHPTVARYRETLERIASRAAKYDRPVVWA